VVSCVKVLVDPDEQAILSSWSLPIPKPILERIAEATPEDEIGARLESHGAYLFGVTPLPTCDRQTSEVSFQEVDMLLSREGALVVAKSGVGEAVDLRAFAEHEEGATEEAVATFALRFYDESAERYLRVMDELGEEIEELDDGVEDMAPEMIRDRVSTLRHGLLRVRQTILPIRDSVRQIMDKRMDVHGMELFTQEIEIRFADVYDKLLRASDQVELLRDMIAGVRDYHMAKIAQDQNTVVTRLTVLASLVLIPTLIVGVYGQNFSEIPETRWHLGYEWSWALILVVTIAQFAIFWRLGWIGQRYRKGMRRSGGTARRP
jgi:magnesium transporter